MASAEEIVAAIGAAYDGVVIGAMAAAAGVSVPAMQSMRRRGVLIHVCRGIDRLRDHPVTWRTRCRLGLAIAGPGSVLGLRTAGRLQEAYAYRNRDEIEVLTLRGGDHRMVDARLVQTRWLPTEHITEVDGLPCTTLARTFFDLCGDPDFGLPVAHPAHEQAMVRLYNDALGRRGLTFTQEAAILVVMARRGRAGTVLVRKILRRFGPEYTPTRSDTETVFFELLRTYRVVEPDKQVPVAAERGWIGTVDFVWRRAKLVVEIDSGWHDGPLDKEEDAARDDALRAAGYTVKRYRYGDVVFEPARVARELVAIVGRGI